MAPNVQKRYEEKKSTVKTEHLAKRLEEQQRRLTVMHNQHFHNQILKDRKLLA